MVKVPDMLYIAGEEYKVLIESDKIVEVCSNDAKRAIEKRRSFSGEIQ